MTTRDSQRQKVYDAEFALRDVLTNASNTEVRTFDFYGSVLTLPDERKFGDLASVQRYVDAVLGLNWVKAEWERAAYPVKVNDTALNHGREAHYQLGTIFVPKHFGKVSWAMREIVVLHEIAHHLCPAVQPHGPDFARTFHKLLSEIIGPEVGLIYQDLLDKHGAKM